MSVNFFLIFLLCGNIELAIPKVVIAVDRIQSKTEECVRKFKSISNSSDDKTELSQCIDDFAIDETILYLQVISYKSRSVIILKVIMRIRVTTA